MNKTIAKLFYRNDYIKIKVIYPDNRIRAYYEIPKDNLVKIKNVKKAFEIQTDKIVYEGKIPVIYFSSTNPLPISFHLSEDEEQYMDMNPDKLYAGLENKLVSQFMSQFFKENTVTPTLIISIITLVLMLGGFFLLFTSLQDLSEQVNSIWDF